MLHMTPLATFDTNTDFLGFGKDIQMEVEYEHDDGRVLIHGINLIRYSSWDNQGRYQEKPLKTVLTIGDAWLSSQTLAELAGEIEQERLERVAEARIEQAEARRSDCWL